MCGRYLLDASPQMLADSFAAVDRLRAQLHPRYNAAPGQLLPVVVPGAEGAPGGARVLELAQWGLVPPPGSGPPMLVNARAEQLGRSRAHREAFQHGRCVVPATGFYEWTDAPDDEPAEDDVDSGESSVLVDEEPEPDRLFDPGPPTEGTRARRPKRQRVPWCFRPAAEGEVFAFAAVASDVADPHGQARRAFAIVTTMPNELVQPVHDRMPAILDPAELDQWLHGTADEAKAAIRSWPAGAMRSHRVGTAVNDARTDGPELIQPLES